MLLSPRHASTGADLLRLLAGWLALLLLLQGCAAAAARGEGPRHLHRPASVQALASQHHHALPERHHHAAGDATVLPSIGAETDGLDLAALALAAALALMAFDRWRSTSRQAGRVWQPAAGWSPCTAPSGRPSKPPRQG